MSDQKKPDAYLSDIRHVFVSKQKSGSDLTWGQFLDNDPQTGQVGLYGTAAGLLALKCVGEQVANAAGALESQLADYWQRRRSDPRVHDNLGQNIRLGFLLLALAFRSQTNACILELCNELANRFDPDERLWLDCVSDSGSFNRASEYSTAIVLIWVTLASRYYKGPPIDFTQLKDLARVAAECLQKRFLDDPRRKRPYLLAMLIAIVIVLGKGARSRIKRELSKYAAKPSDVLSRYSYYLDYKASDGTLGRDYFIVPFSLLAPLLLSHRRLGATHFIYGSQALDKIKNVLDSNDLKVFVEAGGRPSSLEQGVVALDLYVSKESESTKSVLSRLGMLLPKILIESRRPRGQEWRFALPFLVLVYLPVAVIVGASWILESYKAELPSLLIGPLEIAKDMPDWTAPFILLLATSIRKPGDLVKAILRPGSADESI